MQDSPASAFYPFRILSEQANDCALLTPEAQLGYFTYTALLIANQGALGSSPSASTTSFL
jgi:hypothetical protein